LRQLDLELGLAGLGSCGEDVENQLATVEDFGLDNFFKLANLAGREVVVEDYDVGFEALDAGA
jgi:hypothetical protein